MENYNTSEWREMIKSNICDYLTTIDCNHPDFSIKEFKTQLKNIIGIEPGVKIKWNTTEKINELKKSSGLSESDYIEKTEKAEELEITFLDENAEDIKLVNLKFLF